MGLRNRKPLFLIDLDEVLFTRVATSPEYETIIALHPLIVEVLIPISGQLIVLTHRSRSEAVQLLKILPGLKELLIDIVAAEDLIRIALVTGQLLPLFNRGIRKRFVIRIVERKYGVRPENTAILDDAPANVTAILESGGGLGLLAPKPVIGGAEVKTFNLSAALSVYQDFIEQGPRALNRVCLPADRIYRLSELPRGKVSCAAGMNRIRQLAKKIRSA